LTMFFRTSPVASDFVSSTLNLLEGSLCPKSN
jgi:hypothetical protein